MWIEIALLLHRSTTYATAAGVVSVLGVMAVAETKMVIIMGEIDVSIGSVMALELGADRNARRRRASTRGVASLIDQQFAADRYRPPERSARRLLQDQLPRRHARHVLDRARARLHPLSNSSTVIVGGSGLRARSVRQHLEASRSSSTSFSASGRPGLRRAPLDGARAPYLRSRQQLRRGGPGGHSCRPPADRALHHDRAQRLPRRGHRDLGAFLLGSSPGGRPVSSRRRHGGDPRAGRPFEVDEGAWSGR